MWEIIRERIDREEPELQVNLPGQKTTQIIYTSNASGVRFENYISGNGTEMGIFYLEPWRFGRIDRRAALTDAEKPTLLNHGAWTIRRGDSLYIIGGKRS
jgi:hypothetical protein